MATEKQDKRSGAEKQRDASDRGVKFGCYIDLFDGEQPDGCVHDYGVPEDCAHGPKHRSKWTCPYWAPIDEQPADPVATARAEGFRAGAEAMRKMAMRQADSKRIVGPHLDANDLAISDTAMSIYNDIRALPIPEESDNG